MDDTQLLAATERKLASKRISSALFEKLSKRRERILRRMNISSSPEVSNDGLLESQRVAIARMEDANQREIWRLVYLAENAADAARKAMYALTTSVKEVNEAARRTSDAVIKEHCSSGE